MWKRKRKKEWLPWYRARNYRGDLTEAEKRQLDAFRTQPEHPAACLEQLPQEVGDYISRIELQLYERKEQEHGLLYLFVLVGFTLPVLNYFDYLDSKWSYVGVASVLFGLWQIFRYKKKNPDFSNFFDPDAPGTDEEFRQEWERKYIAAARRHTRREGRKEAELVDLSDEQHVEYNKAVRLVGVKCQWAEQRFIEEKDKGKLERSVEICLSHADSIQDDFYQSTAFELIASLLAKAGQFEKAKAVAARIAVDPIHDRVIADIEVAAGRSTSDRGKEPEA